MMHCKMSSVVDSVASAAESVRCQRVEGLAAIDQKGTDVSMWLQEMVKVSLWKNPFLLMRI